ncbi:MAG: hypothetical protein ACYC61_01475 [Isosphaeraceae bacterium]
MSLDVMFQGTMPAAATGPGRVARRSVATPRRRRKAARTPEAVPSQVAEDQPTGPSIGCCERTGVVEIRDPRLIRPGRESLCRALADAAVNRFGAIRAEVALEAAACRLEFDPGLDRAGMAERVASAIRAAIPAVRDGLTGGPGIEVGSSDDEQTTDGDAGSPERRGRLGHLAMAGGSFAMAGAAAILPGLPALPFLVMGGRHSLLVSPRVERLLERHPLGQTVLEKLESESGSSFDWRWLLTMLALAAALAAAIWIFQPPLPVVLLLELGLAVLQACWEWLAAPAAEAGLVALG